MKTVFLSLLFCFLSASSQKCFTVIDTQSNEAIPYVNVWKNGHIYLNSSLKGKFCIDNDDLSSEFRLSCVGYASRSLNVEEKIVYLTPTSIQLDTIKIPAKSFSAKEVTLGNYRNGNVLLSAKNDDLIAEAGKIFEFQDTLPALLKKVRFQTYSSIKDRILGVKIYSLSPNSEPGDLLDEQKISVKKGDRITEVDFLSRNIYVKAGFMVALQILLVDDNRQYGRKASWYFFQPSIGAFVGDPNSFYLVLTEEGKWKKNPNCDLSIEVELLK